MIITRSVKLNRKGQFVIPNEIRDALGLKDGEEILVTLDKERVTLRRPQEYACATRGMLKGTWGKNPKGVQGTLERERHSWK